MLYANISYYIIVDVHVMMDRLAFLPMFNVLVTGLDSIIVYERY